MSPGKRKSVIKSSQRIFPENCVLRDSLDNSFLMDRYTHAEHLRLHID